MAEYTSKKINDMQAAFGGGFIKARAELGVSAFGMQIIAMPPDYGDYPEHDHAGDGQEEVYVVLDGSGTMDVEGDRFELDKETLVSVPSGIKRKVFAGPQGLRMLVLGGCPGKAYEAPEMTELETVA
jgi:mannose-6-phosphate isomerase-like protein (cupin superfamily)